MAEERVHFSGERERVPRGRSIQEREEKLREEVGEVSWVFKLGFLTPPNGCLDQLGPMLALGAALLLPPINKSTCHGQSHCPNFTFSCKVSF